MPNDIRTKAIVLRRTKYGESDRILNILTPEGKVAVLAKGARKEKSKLAGGIELFSVAEVVIHEGRGRLATLTSARMLNFYGNILSDITSLELASEFLRKIEKAAEQIDNPDYFDITQQALAGLDKKIPRQLIKIWFTLNLAQAIGEEVNLTSDVNGEELDSETCYFWDQVETALRPHPQGNIDATKIKLARLILSARLDTVARINSVHNLTEALLSLARTFE